MASTPTTYLGGQKFKSWPTDQLFWLTFLKVSLSLLRPTPFPPTFTPHYHSLTIWHLTWYSIKYGQNEDSSLPWCNTAWAGSQRHSLIDIWWRSQSPNNTYQCPSLGLMPVHHSLSHHISNWFCHLPLWSSATHTTLSSCIAILLGLLEPEDEGTTVLPNLWNHLPKNKAYNPRQPESSTTLWESQISYWQHFTENKTKQIKIK